MRNPNTILLIVLIIPGLWFAGGATNPPPSAATPPPTKATNVQASTTESPSDEVAAAPQRVIVEVSRHKTVTGTIELEDDNVLVVRTLRGEIKSFTKTRIIRAIRLVDPRPDQAGNVFLRNGEVRDGIILADDYDAVVMEINGIRARLRREVVDRVELKPSFDDQYERFKLTLRPGMPERHLMLCEWLAQHGRYEMARAELDALLAAHPEHSNARKLLTRIDAQLALIESRPEPEVEPTFEGELPFDPDAEVGSPDDWRRLPSTLLTAEDVNLIRVFELDFNRPPKVAVSPSTIRTLVETYSTNPAIPDTHNGRSAMFRDDPLNIVRTMFEVRARELYSEIQVLSEPWSLNQFRLRVHNTWLMNSCATSRCHGGPDAGRFFLHNRNYKNERVRYTNLLILERLELDPQWPLLNYDDPSRSLIIQYGLPQQDARKPHPDVKGWRPVFTRGNPKMLQNTVRWMQSMMQPRPDYPVEYEPPAMERVPNAAGQHPTAPGSPDGRADR